MRVHAQSVVRQANTQRAALYGTRCSSNKSTNQRHDPSGACTHAWRAKRCCMYESKPRSRQLVSLCITVAARYPALHCNVLLCPAVNSTYGVFRRQSHHHPLEVRYSVPYPTKQTCHDSPTRSPSSTKGLTASSHVLHPAKFATHESYDMGRRICTAELGSGT